MSNCRIKPSSLDFSADKSEVRIKQASKLFGIPLIKRILAFALYLMGADRKALAQRLELPTGTVYSLLNRISKKGFYGLEDHRRKKAPLPQEKVTPEPSVQTAVDSAETRISMSGDYCLKIPLDDTLRSRTVILSLADNGILDNQTAAELLSCSTGYVSALLQTLRKEGACGLIDQRNGQQSDYKITAQVKEQVIAQTAAHILTGRPASSAEITKELNSRTELNLSDRTVRQHMSKMALTNLKKTLPSLIDTFKKNSMK